MQKRRSQFGEKIAQRVRKEGEAVVGEVERQKSMLERESGSLGQEEVEFDGFNDLSGGKSMFINLTFVLLIQLFFWNYRIGCQEGETRNQRNK